MQVITYDPRYKSAFKSLNVEWIRTYFKVEDKDLEQLDHPENCLNAGGEIFFVIDGETALGTCALYKLQDGRYELAKMGVAPEARGRGVGDLLMKAAEEWARLQGATGLMLQSNTVLTPAISLYKKHGFKEVPVTETAYQRCNIEMTKQFST